MNLLCDAVFASVLQEIGDLLLVRESIKRLVTSVGQRGLWSNVMAGIVEQQFQLLIKSSTQTDRQTHDTRDSPTTTTPRPFVRDYPGEPVPEETLTQPPS